MSPDYLFCCQVQTFIMKSQNDKATFNLPRWSQYTENTNANNNFVLKKRRNKFELIFKIFLFKEIILVTRVKRKQGQNKGEFEKAVEHRRNDRTKGGNIPCEKIFLNFFNVLLSRKHVYNREVQWGVKRHWNIRFCEIKMKGNTSIV